MLAFFRQLFLTRKSANRRAPSSSRFARLELEALQDRIVPSVSHTAHLDHPPAIHGSQIVHHSTHQTSANATTQTTELSVNLQAASGLQLSAEFKSKGSSNVLKIELEHALANQTYSVSLDGGATVLTTLTTDASGNARAVVSSSTLQVQAGTVLTLLDGSNATVVQGAFAAGETENQSGGSTGRQGSELSVNLQAASGLQMSAEFHSQGSNNILKIELEHALANQTYSVSLDGGTTILTTLTTDASGNARAVVSSSTLQVQAGTVLTLLDATNTTVVQGAFAAGGNEHDHED